MERGDYAGRPHNPSPVVPVLLLLILGTMMVMPAMMPMVPLQYPEYDYDVTGTVSTLGRNMVMGVIVIPVLLAIVVQAFGMSRLFLSQDGRPVPPVFRASTRTTFFYLFLIITSYLLLLLLRSNARQSPSVYVVPERNPYYRYPRKPAWYSRY